MQKQKFLGKTEILIQTYLSLLYPQTIHLEEICYGGPLSLAYTLCSKAIIKDACTCLLHNSNIDEQTYMYTPTHQQVCRHTQRMHHQVRTHTTHMYNHTQTHMHTIQHTLLIDK